jgi:hypothetical protein
VPESYDADRREFQAAGSSPTFPYPREAQP